LVKKPSEIVYQNKEKIIETMQELSTDPQKQISTGGMTWLMIGYAPNETSTFTLLRTGACLSTSFLNSPPCEDFKLYLGRKDILFILHRVLKIPDQLSNLGMNSLKYMKPYYGLLLWQGSETSIMSKALSSHHWKDFSEFARSTMDKFNAPIQPGYFHATNLSDITDSTIQDSMKLIDHNS